MPRFLVSVSFVLLFACSSGSITGPGPSTVPTTGPTVVDPTDPALPGIVSEFGLDSRPSNKTCVAPNRPAPTGGVATVRAWPSLSFTNPLGLLAAPNSNTRRYVFEQAGLIKAFNTDQATTTTTPFLDIRPSVNAGGEKGLLGMAFHPAYGTTNWYVYLSYTRTGGPTGLESVISRWQSNDQGATLSPNSEQVLFTVAQPFDNHNGGHIAFDRDGFLFIALGDGGSGGDPEGNGQKLTTPLGKILRVDVNTGSPYANPPSNPFSKGGGDPRIFAWGLRNPWRWSFDRATNELWAADVGQNAREEVDKIVIGGNYGWNIREANTCFDAATCVTAGLIDPVVWYGRSDGVSVTGGYVYRGTAIPSLVGQFVYGDFASGRIWAVVSDPATGAYSGRELLDTSFAIGSFAEDVDGELYVLDYGSGQVNKLIPSGNTSAGTFPKTLSATGCVSATDVTAPSAGVIPYDLNSPLWSDGAAKQRFLAIPDGTKITVKADGDFDFPNGTVLMKTFVLSGKRVETRLFMRHLDGSWGGYTYEWNDAQTDATLLESSKSKQVGTATWYFPSRAECLSCHTDAAGRSLGPELAQLNRDIRYPSTARISNQLTTLNHIGMFTTALGAASGLAKLPSLNGNEPVAQRAKAYLHSNCSNCHRPTAPGRGPGDLRYSNDLKAMGICNARPTEGDLGIAGAVLFAPGDPAKSVMSLRGHRLDAKRMPPLASRVVDTDGMAVVDAWIRSVTSCPP